MPDLAARFEPVTPDYTALAFPAAPAERPYVIMNMVASVDGRAVIEGTERGLGSPTDQRLMRELRVHADIVLNGAGTLRASGTSSRTGDPALEAMREARGKSRAAVAAVMSASGDLPLDRAYFTARDFDAVVYLSTRAGPERRAAIVAMGRPVYDLPAGKEVEAMLRHMRSELNAQLVLVEGGPSVNGQLLELDAVDEIFVTIGPVLVGGSDPRTIVTQSRPPSLLTTKRLNLLSAHPNPDTSETYLRYRIVGSGVEAG
jgi:2,5-diamino-6-(ribosylamino)-4(3H)-pyrimidinone 5'-phosphate reductase